jgi:flagellum-specific peptidoglycan hydrolase FlgJ
MFVLVSFLFFNNDFTTKIRNNNITNTTDPCDEVPVYVCEFIQSISSYATSEMELHGIPASITMAQAILETGYGTSELAIKGNNYFGIKGGYNQCELYYKLEYYRCYEDILTSFQDHSEFLLEKAVILQLIQRGNKNYRTWAYSLQCIDYAFDPEYAEKLIDIIERYELNRFDVE